MEIFLPRERKDCNERSSIPLENPGRSFDSIKHFFIGGFHIWFVANDMFPSLFREANKYSIH